MDNAARKLPKFSPFLPKQRQKWKTAHFPSNRLFWLVCFSRAHTPERIKNRRSRSKKFDENGVDKPHARFETLTNWNPRWATKVGDRISVAGASSSERGAAARRPSAGWWCANTPRPEGGWVSEWGSNVIVRRSGLHLQGAAGARHNSLARRTQNTLPGITAEQYWLNACAATVCSLFMHATVVSFWRALI